MLKTTVLIVALALCGAVALLMARGARAAGRKGDPARAAAVKAGAPAVEFEYQGDVNPFVADPKFPREAFPQLAGAAGCTVRNVLFCRFTYGDCWMVDLGYGVDGPTAGRELCETVTVFRFSDQLRVPAFHLAPRGDNGPWRHATPRLHAVDALVGTDLAGRYSLAGVDAEAMRAVFNAEGCRKLAASPGAGSWRIDGAGQFIVTALAGRLSDAGDLKTYYATMEQIAGTVGVRVTRYLWPETPAAK